MIMMLWAVLAFLAGVLLTWWADSRRAARSRRRISELQAVLALKDEELASAGMAYDQLVAEKATLQAEYEDTERIVQARRREVMEILTRIGKFVKVANVIWAFPGKARKWSERQQAALREVLRRFGGRAPATAS